VTTSCSNVRQKHPATLLVQLAVSIQKLLGADRRSSSRTTWSWSRESTAQRRPPISALRTAVVVAQALGNQKLVLDQITALNTTT